MTIDMKSYFPSHFPVSLARLYRDVLKTDPRVKHFQPREIVFDEGKGIRASDVAGALSAFFLGVGWKRDSPVMFGLQFSAAPISHAIFIHREQYVDAGFLFSLPSGFHPNGRSSWKGGITISRKGAGLFSSGSKQIEYKPFGDFTPGLDDIVADKALSDKLSAFSEKGLVHTFEICAIQCDNKGGDCLGTIAFRFSHSNKKWKKAMEELKLKPEDYIVDTFQIACSLASHTKKYFQNHAKT